MNSKGKRLSRFENETPYTHYVLRSKRITDRVLRWALIAADGRLFGWSNCSDSTIAVPKETLA